MKDKRAKVAVVIGHDKNSPGAYSPFLRESEYEYNSEVATHLNTVADIYERPLGGGYMTKMRKLAKILNPKKYDLVIELHFNNFDNKNNDEGEGCEAVIYPGNEKSRKFGEIYCKDISEAFGVDNRGVKEHGKGERGYGFLFLINAPAVIVEPFFGDEDEALKFKGKVKYAALLQKHICDFKNAI